MRELEDPRYFRVVVNGEGDTGIWPVGWQVPSSWRSEAFTGDIERCAEYLACHSAKWKPPDQGRSLGDGPLISRLVAAAAVHDTRPALRDREVRLTYRELRQAASALAEQLAAAGLGSGHRIAVLVEPSVDLVVCVLGIMFAGAVCVPLAATDTPERWHAVVRDAQPATLITDAAVPACAQAAMRVVDASAWRAASPTANTTASSAYRDELLWIYGRYTAEAGGIGTIWGQRQLTALADPCGLLPVGPGDQVALTAAPDSALAMIQILHGLLAGAELLTDWARWGNGSGTGAIRLISSGAGLPGTGRLRTGRIDTPCEEPAQELIGSAETTMLSASVGPGGHLAAVPGRWLYVLDDRLQPVGEGQTGRLHIGGTGIAGGYAGQAELTVRRFLPDPLAGNGARMFRTDLTVRRLPGNQLAVTGLD
ncbi:MAG: AMP-binding protein [Micromonosporaceae bacterium]|nr:AMP-binding protein [Micromonosporaceae bacterium]